MAVVMAMAEAATATAATATAVVVRAMETVAAVREAMKLWETAVERAEEAMVVATAVVVRAGGGGEGGGGEGGDGEAAFRTLHKGTQTRQTRCTRGHTAE